MKQDYYADLGILPSASEAEIKTAYRRLVLEHHPDRQGDPLKFRAVAEAYAVLGDPAKRQAYDTAAHNARIVDLKARERRAGRGVFPAVFPLRSAPMDTIETLNEYIDSYFNGTKTERESMLAFSGYRDDVLASIPGMDSEFLEQQPACAAIGLLGKLEFKEGAHLNTFMEQPDKTSLAKLRENSVVSVADSARPAWSHLMATNESAACQILSLCAQARKHVRVVALKPKAKENVPEPGNHPTTCMNILSIRETLKAGSAHNAERQLAQIAHDQGDDALALLVADLTPGEVASFLEEGDYSKPSEVTQFLTEEQFMEALARFGAKWGKISKNDSRDILLRLKEEVAMFILPTLLHREDRGFIKAMIDDTLGEDIMVALPLYETGYLEFLREFDSGMAQKGHVAGAVRRHPRDGAEDLQRAPQACL